MKIITLENISIMLECSSQSGIKVLEISPSDALKNTQKNTFDTFEGLLSTVSAAYNEKFANDLFSKLAGLKQNSNDQDNYDESD